MLAIKIILLIMSVFLVVAVLLQEGKSEGMAAIGGANDSYLGKGKKKAERLSTLTTVVAIVFVVIVIILGVFEQKDPYSHPEMPSGTLEDPSYVSTTVPAGTTSAPATPAQTAVSTPDATPVVTPAPTTAVAE